MVWTSLCGTPQQSSYFFPEPHPQGSLRPVLLPIVPSGSEIVSLATRPANNPRRHSVAPAHAEDYGRLEGYLECHLRRVPPCFTIPSYVAVAGRNEDCDGCKHT